MAGAANDPWSTFARLTPARVGLGRAGISLPTREVLAFALAHARARDAVYAKLDTDQLRQDIEPLGLAVVMAASTATERRRYLARPDEGRALTAESRARLAARVPVTVDPGPDLMLVVGDGLSAAAVNHHAVPLIAALLPIVRASGLSMGPVVVAEGARVALGDEIGALMRARLVAVLIGERPGLSSPDSLGVYLTWGPQPGRTDAERNCISNVRPEGLAPDLAARKLAWLIREGLRRGLTGVELKDESDLAIAANDAAAIGSP